MAHAPLERNARKSFNLGKLFLALAVLVIVFTAGIGVGNGRLSILPDSFGTKPVNNDLPEDLSYQSVEQVYDSLKDNFDGELSAEALLDGLKDGLAQATGDPYTEYLNPKEAADFNNELSGTFSGIGAELGKENDTVIIVAPIAGFPAEEVGLRARDVIIKINDESALGISISEAVSKIRGPVGTDVKLTVVRGNTEELEFTITRQQITIPSVESEIIEGNIGYLKVSRYSDDTARLSREAAQEFKNQDVKGVILDLRSNPGGLLNAAVDLSSLWLDRGQTVLEEKRGGTVVKTFTASGNSILKGMPTVVLINEGSASASEITAGALKDHDVATIIGVKSFGKGSVQSLVNLGDSSILKVTIARWFTPNGKNIDKEGIEPDREVKLTEEDFEADRDPQLEAAKEFLGR